MLGYSLAYNIFIFSGVFESHQKMFVDMLRMET